MAIISSGRLVLPAGLGDGQQVQVGMAVTNDGYLGLLTRSMSYAAIVKTQPWVDSAINKLAFATARLPLKVYDRDNDDERTYVPDSPYSKLLANPNPRDNAFWFWLWTVSTFEQNGEAMWLKQREAAGRPPVNLWPLNPMNVTVEYNDKGLLVYRHISDRSIVWDASDVVHFKSYNPDDVLRGMSRLEPLRDSLISEDAVRKAQQSWWKNGARPSVLLQHPGNISEPAAKRLASSWGRLQSGVDNWGKAAVLEEGMQASIMQLTAEQMEMSESRKLSRGEVCGVYDIPPPALQILDDATFSNISEQLRSLYRDTQGARLGLYESALDSQLRPDFDPQGKLYAEFLMDEVLRGDFEQRTEAYQKAITSGWMKPAEARKAENLGDAGEEADRLYVNAALIPMSAQPTEPPEKVVPSANNEAEPEIEEPPVDNNLKRAVLGRLGRVKSVADIDITALIKGLDDESAMTVRALVNAARARGDDIAQLRKHVSAALTGDTV